MRLEWRAGVRGPQRFALAGARRAVAVWSGGAAGRMELVAHFAGGEPDERFVLDTGEDAPRRRSQASRGVHADLAVDELRARVPLDGLTLLPSADVPLDLSVASAAPLTSHAHREPSGDRGRASADDAPCRTAVRPRSQYEAPDGDAIPRDAALDETRRAWCAPTCLAMLLEAAGTTLPTHVVADGVLDAAYRGTGNWSFGAAFAARHGFAAVAYLRDLAHARRFVAAGVPLALSFAWQEGTLPGAPLGESAGHFAVLSGFDAAGDPCFADPAQPTRTATYPCDAFERAWIGHGGVAIVAGRKADAAHLVDLAGGL